MLNEIVFKFHITHVKHEVQEKLTNLCLGWNITHQRQSVLGLNTCKIWTLEQDGEESQLQSYNYCPISFFVRYLI